MTDPQPSLALACARALEDPRRRGLAAPQDLEPLLASIVRRVQARWPGVKVDAAAFVRYLAPRLQDDLPAVEALERTETDDLCLAFGAPGGMRQRSWRSTGRCLARSARSCPASTDRRRS